MGATGRGRGEGLALARVPAAGASRGKVVLLPGAEEA